MINNIKSFSSFIVENKSQIPLEKWIPDTINGKQTKEVDDKLYASTEGDKTLVSDCMIESILSGIESGKRLKGLKFKSVQSLPGQEQKGDVYIVSNPKNTNSIKYYVYFLTEDENVVKQSNGYFEGREWILLLDLPPQVIYNLGDNPSKEKLEEAKKLILNREGLDNGGDWSLIDGMSDVRNVVPDAQGGWQLAWINSRKKELVPADKWKKEDKKEPTTLEKLGKKFRTLMEWHPLKIVLDAISGDDDWRPWKYKD